MRTSRKHPLTAPMIGEVTDIFSALGDASRLRILQALLDAGCPMSQKELVEATEFSQANLSRHLTTLVRVGLVTRDPQGSSVYFLPVLPLVADLCTLICGHVSKQAEHRFKALK